MGTNKFKRGLSTLYGAFCLRVRNQESPFLSSVLASEDKREIENATLFTGSKLDAIGEKPDTELTIDLLRFINKTEHAAFFSLCHARDMYPSNR